MAVSMSTTTRRSASLVALRLRNTGVVYALALIVATFVTLSAASGRPFYLSPVNVSNIVDQSSLVGIIAIFMTIALISGNFDLSVGATGALSAGVTVSLLNHTGLLVAITCGLLCGALIGLINGLLVQVVGVNAFIVTLGTATAIRGALLVLTDGQSVNTTNLSLSKLISGEVPINLKVWATLAGVVVAALGAWSLWKPGSKFDPGVPGALCLIGGVITAVVAIVFFPVYWALTKESCLFFVLAIIAWAVLRFTAVGRRLFAVGGNSEAARLSGIPVARYKIVPFVLTGLSASVVGILYAGRFSAVNPDALTGFELSVLAAAILGGTSLFGGAGSVIKTMVGTFILFVLANGFAVLNLGPNYQGLIQGAVIIVAAAVYVIAGRRPGRQAKPRQSAKKQADAAMNITPSLNAAQSSP